jgi:hypothetical protein
LKSSLRGEQDLAQLLLLLVSESHWDGSDDVVEVARSDLACCGGIASEVLSEEIRDTIQFERRRHIVRTGDLGRGREGDS